MYIGDLAINDTNYPLTLYFGSLMAREAFDSNLMIRRRYLIALSK